MNSPLMMGARLGADLPDGKDHYFQLIQNLATAVCRSERFYQFNWDIPGIYRMKKNHLCLSLMAALSLFAFPLAAEEHKGQGHDEGHKHEEHETHGHDEGDEHDEHEGDEHDEHEGHEHEAQQAHDDDEQKRDDHDDHGHAGHHHDHDPIDFATYPAFTAHLDGIQHFDWIHNADNPANEISDFYFHGHIDFGLHFNPSFRLNSRIKLAGHPYGEGHAHGHEEEEHEEEDHGEEDHEEEEGHGGAVATEDRAWDDQELLIETLNLEYRGEGFSVMGGKFNPVFGLDEHDAVGLYGYQIIDAYRISGRVGVAGTFVLVDGGYGRHQLGASLFMLDTSPLSQTWITRNEQVKRSDGGVSNTGDLSSWTLILTGDELPLEGFSYGLGAAEQAKGVDNTHDEERWWLAMQQRFHVSDWSGRAIFEIMDIDHLNGEAAHDRRYTTAGLSFEKGHWIVGGSYTKIDNSAAETDENHDGHILQASVGYRVQPGVTIEFGFKDSEQDNQDLDRVGLAVRIDTSLLH